MLELDTITKVFRKRGRLGGRGETTVALDSISVRIARGRTLGVIGESGSGKSTLARIALRMIPPNSGTVRFEGRDITTATGRALRDFRRKVQPVFQDSAGALDPRMTIAQILREPLRLRGDVPRAEWDERVESALRAVRLDPGAVLGRYPHQLSGGQRQRITIARTLVLEPNFIVLDEPASALDMLLQAQMVDLLRDLQRRRDLTYLFISHDLRVVASLASHLIVMRHGKVVEEGAAADLFADPKSDYTRALFAAAFRAEATPGVDP